MKNVLITGAGIRIGREIALSMAQNGWGVVVHARSSLQEARELLNVVLESGGSAWLVTGNLDTTSGCEAIFSLALAQVGAIDALVNNASLFTRQTLHEATSEQYEELWRVNAMAPILLTTHLTNHLLARGAQGAVVNLLDQRIARPEGGAIPYQLSKQYLASFTRSAALELSPVLRINGVAPGATLLPTDKGATEPAGMFPTGKRPEPRQIAEAVRFLLESTAITGQILYVDSGQHLV